MAEADAEVLQVEIRRLIRTVKELRNNVRDLSRQLKETRNTLKERDEELDDCKARLAGKKTRPKKKGPKASAQLPYMSLVYVFMFWMLAGLFVMHFFMDIDKGVGSATDAYYATSVTVHGVGFGDIPPESALALILCDMLPVLGYFVPIVLSHFLRRVALWFGQKFIPEPTRFFYGVISAIGMILVTLLSGMIGIYSFELEALRTSLSERQHLSASLSHPSVWADILVIFHLTVMTMTSTGYGDFSFHTTHGRLFATFWIPLCTTSYSVAMTFLVEPILGI